jgi:hypothetical protein
MKMKDRKFVIGDKVLHNENGTIYKGTISGYTKEGYIVNCKTIEFYGAPESGISKEPKEEPR